LKSNPYFLTNSEYDVLLKLEVEIHFSAEMHIKYGEHIQNTKYISSNRHGIGKDRTWKTECKNFNFRTYLKRLNRKTICFSKNEQIHDNVNVY
jgi:IS1 family transposase